MWFFYTNLHKRKTKDSFLFWCNQRILFPRNSFSRWKHSNVTFSLLIKNQSKVIIKVMRFLEMNLTQCSADVTKSLNAPVAETFTTNLDIILFASSLVCLFAAYEYTISMLLIYSTLETRSNCFDDT